MTKKPILSIIGAHDRNLGIGFKNRLPWKTIKEDFKWFQEKTIGHPTIMGRRTFESLGKPLPKRKNIIVTRKKSYRRKNALTANSLSKAINLAKKFEEKEIFIVGGAKIYAQALALADRLYITQINENFKVDKYFPYYADKFPKIIFEKESADKNYRYKFMIFERSESFPK